MHIVNDVLEVRMDRSRVKDGETRIPLIGIIGLNVEHVRAFVSVFLGAISGEGDFGFGQIEFLSRS